MSSPRKILSFSFALLFFLETTVFYSVRAIASTLPVRPAVPSGEPSPYVWRTPEEMVKAAMAELEGIEGAERASALAPPAPAAPPPPLNVGETSRESVSSLEEQGDRASNAPSVSGDGRFVAFESEARNLVPGDHNKKKDVFVRDRELGTTTRVSVASSGAEANGDSGEAAISGDGRWVAFASKASNLVPRDRNKRWDIFLHDRESGDTIAVTRGDRDSRAPAISFDGRHIAFESDARNLVMGDSGHRRDVFVYDRDTGEMSLVSVSSWGEQGNRDSQNASISGDGLYVAFDSKASNLVVGDRNHQEDVFVHDRGTGETTRVSISSLGLEGDHRSEAPSISGEGRFVAFQSTSRNLVPGVFPTVSSLRRGKSKDDRSDDKSKDRKSRDSRSKDDDSSDDDSSDDDSDEGEGRQDHIYVHDRETGLTTLVSQSTDGVPGDKKSSEASIDATGRFVAFASKARNLVSDDTNHQEDVFVRDLAREMTIRVSVGYVGEGDKDSGRPSISGDGSLVAYESKARNLVPGDTNHKDDVFATEIALNRSPVAVDDTAMTLQNTAVDIAVLSNDSDPDGDPLTVDSVESLSGATLEILGDGSVQYQPPIDFVGMDAFTYTIGDGQGGTASATVRVEVSPINQPPVVDAGADQSVVLPASATLQGIVTDDGLPSNTLIIEWTKLSGPDGVTIVSPATAVTEVTFTEPGDYELQLSGSDTEFTVTDTVLVTVEAPMVVTVSVGDVTVVEGSGGMTEAMVPVSLSRVSNQIVEVDYLTFDGTALRSCDYVTRFGTLSFAVGETLQQIRVPIVGDLASEADENLMVRLGNLVGAEMGDEEGVVTIADDDGMNQGPLPAANRSPAHGATGLAPNPTLSWTGSDPDADPLTFDVYFGRAFGTDGQSWIEQCSATAGPGPRAFGAMALDEANDRLILFGGAASGASADDVWVLANASGARGIPSWEELTPGPGPVARQQAVAAYDPANSRLIVTGGCSGDCDALLADTWVLTNANGLGGAPVWEALPDAPFARRGALGAYDPDSNRLIVFGGTDGTSERNDSLILKDANGIGVPEWEVLSPSGDMPSPRLGAAGGYDAERNQLVLFGGREGGDVVRNDVWRLSDADGSAGSPEWSELAPSGDLPGARWGHVAAYEATADRLLVFAGSSSGFESDTNFVANDVWLLTGVSGPNPTWVQLAPENGPIPSRLGPQAAYSSYENRLVVVAGLNNRHDPPLPDDLLNDMWVLDGALGGLPLVSAAQVPDTFASTTPEVSDDYFWRVVTRDDHGAAAGAPVFRFRPNATPTVDAGADQTIRLPDVADLDATVADDGLPGGVTLLWEPVSGPGTVTFGDETAEDTTASFSEPGVYVLRLTANDGELQSASEVTITVEPANQPPSVEAGPDQEITLPQLSVTLAASVTDDGVPPGNPVTLLWTSTPPGVVFSSPIDASTDATFPGPGLYTLRITASDGELEAFDELTVTVIQPNAPPIVNAGDNQATSLPTATITLNGVVTDDGLPSGTLTSAWSLVSGPGNVIFVDENAPVTDASFDAAGAYTLRLTATDTELITSDDVEVIVASDVLPPDLTIDFVDTSALVVDPQTLEISGTVAAVVGNIGAGPAAGPFEVTFFEDLNRNGTFEPFEDNIVGVGSLFGVDAAASGVAVAPVNPAALAFQGNLIYAFADSSLVVDETDETNNIGSSAATCETGPFPTGWNVQLEWAWRGSTALPDSGKVLTTPVVMDVNGDRIPDVIFSATDVGTFTNGRLTAVSGADGSDLWQVTNPAYELQRVSQLAVGDIDLDGLPEIVAGHEDFNSLIAFEHDGTFKWKTAPGFRPGWGGPSIGDLDADGTPEIIFGRQVLNNDGTLRWTGTGGQASVKGPLSTMADLDMDGVPELVAGNTAYRSDGSIYWRNGLADGMNAVGNFDADPFPEIVWIRGGQVALMEHDGTIKWGPNPFPLNPRNGGPPVAADFDGDGLDEIGVPDSSRYYVFDGDGTLLWEAFIEENSDGNGSSAFDFDGDGAADLVYADSQNVFIRRGTDGVTLFETPLGNITAYESAIVADVDGDGEAELVAVADGYGRARSQPGVYVFGELNGYWTNARPVYNQHTYHVTNVNDDGTIPVNEVPAWSLGLGFRHQAFASVSPRGVEPGCQFAKPDLTGSQLRVSSLVTERELTVRVGNGGESVAGARIPVTFYDGDPALGGLRLGTAFTSALMSPGEFEDVTLVVPIDLRTTSSVWISVDDFGGLVGGTSESDEDNNVFDSGQALLGASGGQTDLVVVDVDTSDLTGDWQSMAVSGSLAATVRNQGDTPTGTTFEVTFFEDLNRSDTFDGGDQILGVASQVGLPAGASAVVQVAAAGTLSFRDAIVHAFVDSGNVVSESDEDNNVTGSASGCRFVPVVDSFDLELEWSWTGSPVLPASDQVLMTPMLADINADGFPDVLVSTRSTSGAHLRALSGKDGSEIFTADESSERVSVNGNLAVGDIDRDGDPEIVALDPFGNRLRAFSHDGTLLWTSSEAIQSGGSGAPALADLEGDGPVEIIMGRQVLDASGNILWTGARPSRGTGQIVGPMSYAVDLDLDGTLEVVAGNTAYDATGTLLWENTEVGGDGMTAVGNFDTDEFPEIAIVRANGAVYLLEHDGALRWGPVFLSFGIPGPPTIADFDGDGRPEIAVASRDDLHVIEGAGFVRWKAPITHNPGVLNGGSAVGAFDFDGDGAVELVYYDEVSLRIYDGASGSVLGETPLAESCQSGRAFPVVADIDADGDAEIVVGANSICSFSETFGVLAFGEARGNFVDARGIFNQHGYRGTNVNDDGTLPLGEEPSWLRNNSHRAQVPAGGARFAAPDLSASFVRRAEDGADLVFTVRIANGGAGEVGAGVPVSVYNGDPRLSFPLLDTFTTTRALSPGEFEDVEYRISSFRAAQGTLHFVADDSGDLTSTVDECNEDNNLHDSGFSLNRPPEVEAGEDAYTAFPDPRLPVSAIVSDDGLPLTRDLTLTWVGRGGTIDFPIFADFDDPNAAETVATFPAPGSYLVGITAYDGSLQTSDNFLVVVDRENEPPVVNAGADVTVELPNDVATLNGVVTDDGLPSNQTLTTTWSQVSGPMAVVFADPSSISTTVTLPEEGEYVLRLTADDGAAVVSDDVLVTVTPPNQAPVVNAGPDEAIFSPSTLLNGSASDDDLPIGSALTTTWSVVSGPGVVLFDDANALATRVRFGAAGDYVLQLTASDTALSSVDDVTISVDVTNVAPVVDAGPNQTIVLPMLTTTLAGNVTDDGLPLGSTVAVVWNLISGPAQVVFGSRFELTTSVTFTAAGTYSFELAASDSELIGRDQVEVFVDDGNVAPIANAGPDQTIALPTNEVTLSGSATDDGLPAGSILSYSWSQVSGPGVVVFASPNTATTIATFEAAGEYVLALTVSDTRLTGTDEILVTINPAPPGPPPTVEITSPVEREGITDFTDVVGTVQSPDLLSWKLEARQDGTEALIRLATGNVEVVDGILGQFDPTLLMNGLYELRLTATDNADQTAAASVFVVVKENLKIGHFTISFVDLEVPVAGLPIRITRTYDSRDKRQGDFGFGWRMDLSSIEVSENAVLGLNWFGQRLLGGLGAYCVTPVKAGVVTITMPDGEVLEFEPVAKPVGAFRECQLVPFNDVTVTFRPLPGTNATLQPADGDFAYVIGSFPGPVQLFDTSFDLYDPQVYRLTLPDGRAFVIDQTEGLKNLTDLNGNRLTITPDGVTHSSGRAVAFDRDPEGRITSITDPNGNPMFYEYDANGDLVSYRDREDNETKFTYLAEVPHHLDGIEDPRGIQPLRNEYDPDTGRLLSHTDALGNTITYTHNIGVRQEEIRDRTGALRVLEYDERGNVVLETDPLGRVVLRSFDANNNRTCETEPHDPARSGPDCESSPNPTLFVYDSRDNVLSQTDPEGNTTSFTYNARDQVETTTDPRGKVTTSIYDGQGKLIRNIDAAGTETVFTYDAQGNLKAQTVNVGGVDHTTSFDYDAQGNLTREVDAQGNETTFTYDLNGNRQTETRIRTLPSQLTELLVTELVYDKLGRLVKKVDPDGSVTTTVYDAIGKQKEIFDKLGRKKTFEYDVMGQLAKFTYPDAITEQFTYDEEGRRRTSKDRANRTTSFEYDPLDRLTKTTFPDGTYTENVYDDAGRLEQSIDGRGKITRFEYNDAGRRTAVIDPLLNRTEFTYDANGNQKTVKAPNGEVTVFEYDDLNRRTKTIFPDLTFTESAYDELGRRVAETDQAGIVTAFEYDKVGRLTKVIQDVGGLGLETTYEYDEVGNRVAQTDANGHTTGFEYDEMGRETKRILPDNAFEMKAYDAAGNLTVWTKLDGSVVSFDYDVNDRLMTKDFPTGADVTFTYTDTGLRKTVVDRRGTTSYVYDLRDRLQTLTYPDGRQLDYAYDANGNRTSLTATIGTTVLTTTYSYDDASRLDVATDPNLGTYDHDYDANGNRSYLSHPDGTSTSYSYDTLNRLTDLTTAGPAGTIQSYQFTLGPAGNRTRIDEADGTFREYGYDSLYRLTTETVSDLSGLVYEKIFTYDDVGNRLTQDTNGQGAGNISYTYDTRDRLLTENATTYGYDDNGNLTLKSGEATYTWDFEDRLIRVEKTDGTVVTHAYDADGNRIRTEVTPTAGPSEISDFLVDSSGPLSHVVAETDSAGDFVAYYVRGDDLLSVIRPSEQRYYHADGVGSIRVLTDELGNISDSYDYTAFGEKLRHVGVDTQPYQFAGEPFDLESNHYYNRARWMNPSTGRFLSADAFEGILEAPLTLNKYVYANTNPPNNVDPSGKVSLPVAVAVLGIAATLATISILHFRPEPLNLSFPIQAPAFTVSPRGMQFLRDWEGFDPNLYDDAAGHCTIGYGHLVHLGNCNGTESAEFLNGITVARGEQLLFEDAMLKAVAPIRYLINVPLRIRQFDALTSFTYNVGSSNLATSTLRTVLNNRQYNDVPAELMVWVYAGGVVIPGLQNRRNAEIEVWNNGNYTAP